MGGVHAGDPSEVQRPLRPSPLLCSLGAAVAHGGRQSSAAAAKVAEQR